MRNNKVFIYKNIIGISLLLALPIFFSNCSKNSTNEPDEKLRISPPGNIEIKDISNFGDARDFELSFNKLGQLDLVTEFRVFAVKSEQADSFDSVSALQNQNYRSIDKSTSAHQLSFGINFFDTDGEAITENRPYNFFVLAYANTEMGGALSSFSETIELQQKSAVRTIVRNLDAGSGGMELDTAGNILMGNFGNTLSGGGSTVIKITPEGASSVFVSGLNGASGNDLSSDGSLFQSNITGGFISRITPEGVVTQYANAGLVGPVGVVEEKSGELFVADCGDHTIKRVDQNGVTNVFASGSALDNSCPNGIDIDDNGDIYVAPFNTGNIFKVNASDSTVSVFATIPGNNNGHLLISGDLMYVVARSAHQIYTVKMQTAEVNIFAGSGSRGVGNGSLDEATFSLPNDIALSPDGSKLYINDVAPDAGAQSNISPVYIRVIDIVNE